MKAHHFAMSSMFPTECSGFMVCFSKKIEHLWNILLKFVSFSALDYVKFAKDEPFHVRQIPTYLGLMVPIFHCLFAITAICYDFNDFDGLMNALIGTSAAFNVRHFQILFV